MIIENYTAHMVYVVSYFGSSRSVSYSMIPSRSKEKAPKVTLGIKETYELPGILQVRDRGFVINSDNFTMELMVFDGQFGRFERQSRATMYDIVRKTKEGVLVSTQSFMSAIGI